MADIAQGEVERRCASRTRVSNKRIFGSFQVAGVDAVLLLADSDSDGDRMRPAHANARLRQ